MVGNTFHSSHVSLRGDKGGFVNASYCHYIHERWGGGEIDQAHKANGVGYEYKGVGESIIDTMGLIVGSKGVGTQESKRRFYNQNG